MYPCKQLLSILLIVSFAIGFSCCDKNQIGGPIGHETPKTYSESSNGSTNKDNFGIDISHHNGVINWKKVAGTTSLLFVYIKATEGSNYVDPLYHNNLRDAKENGFKVGSYHFFRMTSSAHGQFDNFKKNVDSTKQDLIPMVDVETNDNHSNKELRDSLNVFIDLIKLHYGHAPMIYATNKSYNQLCGGLYGSYHLYIGRYGKNPPSLKGKGKYTIWQYTENAKIDGIPKPVDKAIFNEEYTISDILLRK